jgi:hypothetical protein
LREAGVIIVILLTGTGSHDEVSAMKTAIHAAKVTVRDLADRKIRERLQDARRLAGHRVTKRQMQARNSCVANARTYRVASHRSVYAYV